MAAKNNANGSHHEVRDFELDELHLDPNNPRFGMAAGRLKDESEVLEFIVKNFGVEDVLSSIAVNGYFASEPLLLRPGPRGNGYIVAEGNRRLAACLILAGDKRARGQKRRTEHYQAIHKQYGGKPFEPVAGILFQSKADIAALTPYLGVRHIAGAQQWDSYAKAAWVARAVEEDGFALDDIIVMIGDNTHLARRMLQGYYVVRQLVDTARFDPTQSQKRGQKSNPEFPFSWVYTALNFKPIREWLSLPDEPKAKSLAKESLDRGGQLFAWMFGQAGRAALIDESRDIKDLARCIEDPEQRRLLRSGIRVDDVLERSRPVSVRLSDRLTAIHESLREILPELAENKLSQDQADELIPLAHKIRTLSIRVHKELQRASGGGTGDNE